MMIIDVSRNMVNGDLMNEHGDERVHYKWGYDLYSWSYHHDLGCNLSKSKKIGWGRLTTPQSGVPFLVGFPRKNHP